MRADAPVSPPSFGLIVVGDEILSGRRSDKHLAKVIELLAARGLQLGWAEYVGDERAHITATLRRVFASGDIAFCTGGIGATPDDHTRQCAAAALGVPLVLHPEAKALIEERMEDVAREQGVPYEPERADNLHRLNMGVFPEGARIIPNPYNKIPGFFCAKRPEQGNHPAAGPLPRRGAAPSGGSATGAAVERGGVYFTPGFPVMAWPMIEWVLDHEYPHLHRNAAWQERSVLVYGAGEATLTPVMERVEAAHPRVKVFSLPSVDHPEYGRHIDLGVKGAPGDVGPAYADLRAWLQPFDLHYGPELVRP
ncbi:molybdopterin-binding protein [Ottowia sp.]|uniref:competence/damage-inducible protein A n=1 Tax=Ottowia sp. TaxID=1898956 RepID=UPI002CE38555|nr:molybdopterin-binding protein [Ottowia sp.]HRN76757.1 molybdopterin-binding protein [Ottowia sp.]HRQ03869.1 molybdopterin-binding protein [Ottowia sp.]